jgi:hypothetical protein
VAQLSTSGDSATLLMKSLIFALLLVTLWQPASARIMRGWTYQEMLDQSDLVVIARPVATKNTPERTILPHIAPDVHVLGVETDFEVSAVLKGGKDSKKFAMHHYNLLKPDKPMIDGPSLFSFEPKDKQKPSFLLFLVREPDGRYAPVTGQTDPTLFSILALRGIPE